MDCKLNLKFLKDSMKQRGYLGGGEGLGYQTKKTSVETPAYYCQRASRAKTRGWRGGSIIEPCESTV